MTGRMRASFRLGCVGATVAVALTALAGVGHADSPSPTPSATASPSASPIPSASPTPSAKTPTTSARTTPGQRQPQAEQASELSLTVRSTYGDGTAYWSDIGAYVFEGSAGLADGRPIEVYYRAGTGGWRELASSQTAGGEFAINKPIGGAGTFTFIATTGGVPGTAGDQAVSNTKTVTVGDSRIVFNRPVAEIDALKDPRLSGSIVPGRAGVTIHIDLLHDGRFVKIAETRTDVNGRFATNLSYGRGSLASYRIRASHRVPNRAVYEVAKSHLVKRIAVLNGVVTPTTAAEVASTYHAGCPVGRSRLRTVTMNYYGTDKKMHRGVLIVRSDLTGEITYAFSRSISVRFPITKMVNPIAYRGNDPAQMRADNSSGFNCRAVVGNPYRRSPHSYGIAIDVNPRQNPYRDVNGKWWPENGTGYIDRTPRRLGMLSLKSTMVKALRNDGFFWGGLWSPGRDYQHFQY